MALELKERQPNCTRLMDFSTQGANVTWTAQSSYLLEEVRVRWAHRVGTGNDIIYVELYKGEDLIASTTIASNSLPGDPWCCAVVHSCATTTTTTINVGPVGITLGEVYKWKFYTTTSNGVVCYGRCGTTCPGFPGLTVFFANYGSPVVAPTVSTNPASGIEKIAAAINGEMTATGGENADERGFDYGETIAYGSSWTESGSFGVASFAHVLTGLSPNTTYHFRAKAHNSAGWGYGADVEFTTLIAAPTVTTNEASGTGLHRAAVNGEMTDVGGENADERGFDYGLTAGYGSEWTESGSFSAEEFSHTLSGLDADTTYHFRAKAHNSAGWGHGGDKSFTTGVIPPTPPTELPEHSLAQPELLLLLRT